MQLIEPKYWPVLIGVLVVGVVAIIFRGHSSSPWYCGGMNDAKQEDSIWRAFMPLLFLGATLAALVCLFYHQH